MPELLYKNANIHYSDQGKGPVLLFLHGFLEDLTMWNNIVKSFHNSHRTLSVDLLGHGNTDSIGYIHSMEDQARMLKFLLEELKILHCVVIGHSMGGYIALAFADLFPEMMRGLCLMNSTSYEDSEEKKHNRDRGIKAVKSNHKTFIRVAIPSLFSEKNRTIFTDDIRQVTDTALQMSKQGIIAALEGMKIREDRSHLLKKANYPILMIIGKEDPALAFQSLLKQTENTKVHRVIFEDGHMSHIENEADLIQEFRNFL
ncbi:alpha/beta fold hydrolase [Lutimonas sp.]|uniref:alpha/beta fold hydrolase n=1 Tax=Lutimonas sp. TaxID=1872403 RepID=UPI003D9B7AEB